jgi:hypothetical protein
MDGWMDGARKTQWINRQRVRETYTFQYFSVNMNFTFVPSHLQNV